MNQDMEVSMADTGRNRALGDFPGLLSYLAQGLRLQLLPALPPLQVSSNPSPPTFCTPLTADVPVQSKEKLISVYYRKDIQQNLNSQAKQRENREKFMEIKAGLVFIFSFPTEEDKVVAQGLRELHIMHYCSLQSTIQQGTPIKQTM